MPYRPPLVPHETFVADPVDLPVRRPGEHGLSAVARAETYDITGDSVGLKAATADGQVLAVRVAVAGEGVIRVRLSQDPDAVSRSAPVAALVHPQVDPAARIEQRDGQILVHTAGVTAELTTDPWRLRFLDPAGRVLLAENPGEEDISTRVRTLPLGRSMVDGTVAAYHECFDAAADEHFVGLGERFTGFDKRGQRALMWNYDAFGAESDRAYKNVPFYLSSRGYGVLVDSGTATEFDLCASTHSCVQIVVPDDLIDYYVLAGPTPAAVLGRLRRLTGAAALPPKWAFGTWISSGFVMDTQQAVLERAARIRDTGTPCDVLHLDTYWQSVGHWSDLRWDAERFPDPRGMLATLAEQGFRVCLWINSYVSRLSPDFDEAARRGYFLRRPDGSVYVADVWHGSHPACGIVDFTNPEATEWYARRLRDLLADGVAVFKTDFGEGVPADAVAHNGMAGTTLHNVYSLLFNDVVARVTEQARGYPTVWARSSFLGGQRHAPQWSGDVNCTYPAMASTLRGGLSHGLSGMPFWSHDAGGFFGTPTPDLYTRWIQFGALSPMVRLHGTSSRLPWDFPTVQEDAIAALRLRYRLMPYLYSAAVDAARAGLPMMRPLLVDHPDDPVAWQADLEYLLGPDLLVAPMTDPSGSRPVYLPQGRWVDRWTGAVHDGGRYVTVTLPVARVPLFVRYGALVPTAPAGDTVGDGPYPELTVECWDGDGGAGTVIRDTDGDTVVSTVRRGGTLAVTVEGPATVRAVAFPRVDGSRPPATVTINGVPAPLATVDGRPLARLP